MPLTSEVEVRYVQDSDVLAATTLTAADPWRMIRGLPVRKVRSHPSSALFRDVLVGPPTVVTPGLKRTSNTTDQRNRTMRPSCFTPHHLGHQPTFPMMREGYGPLGRTVGPLPIDCSGRRRRETRCCTPAEPASTECSA